MYRFKSNREAGVHDEVALGFYRNEAAIEHARKLSYRAPVEIWRDDQLVARFERVTDVT